jgi:endonuclease/exonuclease/phosphatase family metal-dependent hydrolase
MQKIKDPIRITTLTRIWKKLRRKISRSEWAVRLLGLPRTSEKPTKHGLVLIQIDGLSEKQLHSAISAGKMPFVKSLLEKQKYVSHTMYSGLPSSTPAVQGELFYGQRTIVPAFGFRDHRTGHLVRMFANDIAQEVESELIDAGEGLLKGGSSYCNIYGGGASDVHFCATSFGWSEFFSTVNPFKILMVLVLNIFMFVRVAWLMIVELFLATYDFIRGIAHGRSFWQELIMIPARVIVCVLLRELVTVGTCVDTVRGQPIIHLNLLGYDEQAHRRGPDSAFAHWTLRGIDHCIRRIWKSAINSDRREYDIWIFSDHGQEKTKPYQLQFGKSIQQTVAEIVDQRFPETASAEKQKSGRVPTRANWLGIGWLVSMLFGEQDADIQARSGNVQTVTSGPVGFVYLLNKDARQFGPHFASRLVSEFNVPMIVMAKEKKPESGLNGSGRVNANGQLNSKTAIAYTSHGEYLLPRDNVAVFGADHPFLEEITTDMIQLAHHVDSGDMILLGWCAQKLHTRHQAVSTSFVLQNGAHAGPGPDETGAFALLPADIGFADLNRQYLRPDDLRQAALRFLNRDKPTHRPIFRQLGISEHISVLSYNVHACVGMDGKLSPERIARVIGQAGANIICLQELDVFRKRSGNLDQAHQIAEYLEMQFQFHPAWHVGEERFGNAVLTRFPMKVVRADGLHHHKADRTRRSALWVEISINDHTNLQVINTHLSIYPKERVFQAKQLMELWVQPASERGPVILCGDFNAVPNSKTCKSFRGSLSDVESFDKNPTVSTYFSPFPVARLDHVFVSDSLSVKRVHVHRTRLASIASDHLPLSAEILLAESTATQINTQTSEVCSEGSDL